MNKKLIAVTSSVFLFISVIPANGAVKAGAICKNIGITTVSSGKTYTCIKFGKKLVWNKGVKIEKSTQSALVPPRPNSFDDLISKSDGISYWA